MMQSQGISSHEVDLFCMDYSMWDESTDGVNYFYSSINSIQIQIIYCIQCLKLSQNCRSSCIKSQVISIKLKKTQQNVPGPPPELSASDLWEFPTLIVSTTNIVSMTFSIYIWYIIFLLAPFHITVLSTTLILCIRVCHGLD